MTKVEHTGDLAVAMEPEKLDVERLILSELRHGPKKPEELTRIHKDNSEISRPKYYRTLNRLIRMRRIDELDVRGKKRRKVGEYKRISEEVVEPERLDLPILEMIGDSDPDILTFALGDLESVVESGRTAWYFSKKTRTRPKEATDRFFSLLGNPSPEIRKQILKILTKVLKWEKSETRSKKDFVDQIWERVLNIARTEENVQIRSLALNLVGLIDPAMGLETALGIVGDTSLSSSQFGKLRPQVLSLPHSKWGLDHKVEVKRRLLDLYNSSGVIVKERIRELLKELPPL